MVESHNKNELRKDNTHNEMDYFRNGLKSVLGPPPGNQPTGAETVERLVSRVSTSTLLEDRRDACRALRALSKKYRLEVGAQGMDVLRQVLELDRSDCEIVGYCLDTLCNITAKQTFEEEMDNVTNNVQVNVGENFTETFVGEQFTEMFLKNPENVNLVLSFMEEYDFRVRWPAVKLMTSLILSKPKVVQDIVLVSPMGVSKLMDLLLENREVIRNDALLLLINLTKSNANIQKIVAFENAFDRLFDVINSEGGTDGGIVVEDCFLLLLNLLRNNTSNIHFFKEGSYIQKLAPMFTLPPNLEEVGWTPQKVSNFHCMLLLVRTLVSPNNPAQLVAACQKVMRNTNLLEALSNILMAAGVPANILTETINTLGEVIRGNLTNQEFFANVQAPSNPPRPVMVVLLMSMVNEKQPLALRCAVSYCLQCYLSKNEVGQQSVIDTLLPGDDSATAAGVTSGQLLCGGLLGGDAAANWLSAVALSHCLVDNAAQKGRLLRAQLATRAGAPPSGLLQQAAAQAQRAGRLQSRLGGLMLLAQWVAQSPPAVGALLGVPGAVAFLTAQTSASECDDNEELQQGLCAFLMGLCVAFNDNTEPNYSKENLSQLIEKRVGIETYCRKLSEISRHEAYALAAKQPQVRAKRPDELLLEYEFCQLFRSLEGVILQALGRQRELFGGISELSLGEHENALLAQYKELIRDQDKQIRELRANVDEREKRFEELKAQFEDLQVTNKQLVDQNTLLKAQLAANCSIGAIQEQRSAEPPPSSGENDSVLQGRICQLESDLAAKAAELDRIRKDQDDLLELLTDQDLKLNSFKDRLRELGENVEDGDSDNNSVDSENS